MREASPFPKAAAVADAPALTSAQRSDNTTGTPSVAYAAAHATIYNGSGENDSRARICADVNALHADLDALRTSHNALLASLRAAGLISS